ncbi:hypothetical protein [Haloarcula halophila]|uniref:hypothetical protein n=1 Tax=Haloarcula TaxID=2237 RepID=UPI0023E3F98F|nr:hypothetical protein [Halomicroarcula sp. DFY41]
MADERSHTVWERLEPVARNEDLQGTLRGELADPLWLLSRQRQFGEFAGEDAGSPVEVAVEYYHDHVDHVEVGSATDPYDPKTDPPVETLVEREPVAAEADDGREAPNHALRAEAGMNVLDRLRRAVDADSGPPLPEPDWFEAAYHLDRPDVADGPARRFADVFDGEDDPATPRGLDGHAVYGKLTEAAPGVADSGTTTDWLGVSDPVDVLFTDGAPDVAKSLFKGVAKGFAEWYAGLFDEPSETEDAWDPARMEYSAAVSAGTGTGRTTLEAREYEGGRLDWYDFESTNRSLVDEDGDSTDSGSENPHSLSELPTNTRFRGMPASRLWEMEDADVDLASMTAAGDDLSRLFMLEFALIAGDDWFSLPIEAPVGSVTRVSTLSVTDTFDKTTADIPATVNRSDAAEWDMFTFDLPNHDEPGLFLPPVLGTSQSGEVIEEVLYGRDEMANLVFGLESTVEGALGDPLDREEFRAPSLGIEELHTADDALSGQAAADDEAVVLANEGDDVLVVGTGGDADSHWELRVEDPDAANGTTTVDIPPLTIPAEGSVRVVSGTGVDTDEEVHLDRSAPLLGDGDVVSVYKPVPADEGSSSNGDSGPEMGLVAVEPVDPETLGDLRQYKLANEVADHWFPYLPVNDGLPQRLELGLLLDADALSGTLDMVPEPMGRILNPEASIYAEEVSRTGRRVTRSFQASAWLDGRSHVWSSREVGPGRGEVSSGLRFDFLEDEEA